MASNTTVTANINETLGVIADHIGDLYELARSSHPESPDAQPDPIFTSFFAASRELISTKQNIAVSQQNNVRGFYRLVRDFAIRAKPWTEAIRYHIKPDERLDLTLVSRRVYGYPEEYIAVMASAGLDSVENTMSERLLTLPPPSLLAVFKLRAGYRNLDMDRPFNG